MGPTSASIIQIKDETSKSAGDKVTYGLRMQLQGSGVVGDGTLEGQEEALTTFSDAVMINQLRHAVRSAGRMTQQRVPFNIREEALSGLRDWWADRVDWSFFNQICGYGPTQYPSGFLNQADVRWSGLQGVTAPDVGHKINADTSFTVPAGDQSMTTTATFTLSLIDRAIERARTISPAIRPVRVGAKDFYVLFMHPYQVTDMRTNTSTGQWLDIQKAAMTGGEIEDNPIFDGSLGMYNGTILHSDYRVTQGVDSVSGQTLPYVASTQASANVRRAVFCGAQAAMAAYGRDNAPERYTWVEELFDSLAANDNSVLLAA